MFFNTNDLHRSNNSHQASNLGGITTTPNTTTLGTGMGINSSIGLDHTKSTNTSTTSTTSSFIDKIRDKFANNQLVSDVIMYHNSKVLTLNHRHQQEEQLFTIEPPLSDALFIDVLDHHDKDHTEVLPHPTCIHFHNTKFIITQRPASNMILASTLHQRQALLLSQIYANCFLVLRFERRQGVMMMKTIQDAISYIEQCIEL